jgi:hypothetical protein
MWMGGTVYTLQVAPIDFLHHAVQVGLRINYHCSVCNSEPWIVCWSGSRYPCQHSFFHSYDMPASITVIVFRPTSKSGSSMPRRATAKTRRHILAIPVCVAPQIGDQWQSQRRHSEYVAEVCLGGCSSTVRFSGGTAHVLAFASVDSC